MTYTQIPVEKFGGLDLRAEVEADIGVTRAVSGSNFELGDSGIVSSRRRFVDQGILDFVPHVMCTVQAPASAPAPRILAGGQLGNGSEQLWIFTYGTGLTQVQRLGSSAINELVAYGDPNGETAYIFYQGGVTALGRYNCPTPGSDNVSQPPSTTIDPITLVETVNAAGTLPRASLGAVWPGENRLVTAGFFGATHGPNGLPSSPHHVWFSEPGRPTVFRTDAFVVLTPGDGEVITAVRAWREFVFVFKQTKFFVFQNVGSSNRGVPTFSYRPVDSGVGCVGHRAVAVGPDGLYFASSVGLHVTRGSDPAPVGQEVAPLWSGRVNELISSALVIEPGQMKLICLTWHDQRLYAAIQPTSGSFSNGRILVWDRASNWWSIWRVYGNAGGKMVQSIHTPAGRKLFVCGGQPLSSDYTGIAMYDPSSGTGDTVSAGAGSPIAPAMSYRTGYLDLAEDSKARVRQLEVWGGGNFRVACWADYRRSADTARGPFMDFALRNPADPADATAGYGLGRRAWLAQRGALEFITLGVSQTPVEIDRVVLHVSNKRVPSAL